MKTERQAFSTAERRDVNRIGVLLLLFSFGCGSDPEPGFTPCGGNVVSGWDFLTASFPEGGDQCPSDKSIGGFLFFNDNDRYSLNATIEAWKKEESATTCNFTAAYGGFYKVDGTRICMGGSAVQDVPCEGNTDPLAATLSYCVSGDTLSVKTSNFLNLRFPAVIELKRKP